MTLPDLDTGDRPTTSVWDYGAARQDAVIKFAKRGGLFINGRFVKPNSRNYRPSVNPATGRQLCRVADADAADVDDAVTAAKSALRPWTRLKPKHRTRMLLRIAQLVENRADELAAVAATDEGTPIRLAREQVRLAARIWRYDAGWCDKLPYLLPGGRPKPVGVCGLILPPGSTILAASLELAAALACGNCCILIPDSDAALAVLRLARILQHADLPHGVVNVVTGTDRAPRALAAHRAVKRIVLDATPEIAETLAAHGPPSRARISLSRPGAVPQVIFEDASIDQAVEGAVLSAFMIPDGPNLAPTPLFVQESVLDEVRAKLRDRLGSLRLGDPLDVNTDVGPLLHEDQLHAVRRFLDDAVRAGAKLYEAGQPPLPDRGFWQRPCLLAGMPPAPRAIPLPLHGPVLTLTSFRTPAEALAALNALTTAHAAAIWTDKGAKMFEFARRLNVPIAWCNSCRRFDPAAPPAGVAAIRPYLDG